VSIVRTGTFGCRSPKAETSGRRKRRRKRRRRRRRRRRRKKRMRRRGGALADEFPDYHGVTVYFRPCYVYGRMLRTL
jgi:hypothetical protein